MNPIRTPGIPLVKVGGLPPVRAGLTPATAPTPAPAVNGGSPQGPLKDLAQIIHPSARDRWMTRQESGVQVAVPRR